MGWVLNCPPQAYKSCACPALRQKKEARVSNRVTNGLTDGELIFEVRSLSDIPCVQEARHGAGFAPEGWEDGQLYEDVSYMMSGWSWVIRETERGACPSPPL